MVRYNMLLQSFSRSNTSRHGGGSSSSHPNDANPLLHLLSQLINCCRSFLFLFYCCCAPCSPRRCLIFFAVLAFTVWWIVTEWYVWFSTGLYDPGYPLLGGGRNTATDNYSIRIGEIATMEKESGPQSSRYAHITLVTGDAYVPGALALYASFVSNRKFEDASYADFVCAITEKVSEESKALLKKIGFKVIKLDAIAPPPNFESKARGKDLRLAGAYTKLSIWALEEYEQMLFLDSDTIILHDTTHLFDAYPLAMMAAVRGEPLFNSGVMLFKPNVRLLRYMLDVLHDKYSGFSLLKADQGFLSSFFNNGTENIRFKTFSTCSGRYKYTTKRKVIVFEQLPGRYNTRVTDFSQNANMFYEYSPFWPVGMDDIKFSEAIIVHFNGVPKPWDKKVPVKSLYAEYGVLYQKWKKYDDLAQQMLKKKS
eukprot:Nk52_evm34s2402 gene=Nk52_evmTU34s2402